LDLRRRLFDDILVGPARTFLAVHDVGHFTDEVAAGYDDPSWEMFAPHKIEPVVDFLVEQGRGGDALEFGIGTGRIALPLAERGLTVKGIDMSRPMVDRLRKKSGNEDIEVTIGDFATTRVSGSFSVVYLVFNTIMNLTTQAAQVACFRNAATHLERGGKFVIEVMIPDLRSLPPGQSNVVVRSDETGWGIDEYDVAAQGLVSHHLKITAGQVDRLSIPFRYVWPSELDLMAEMAGMGLMERYDDWNREPFNGESRQHVSMWEKPND
jgi:SAM-dependent methyltransferase